MVVSAMLCTVATMGPGRRTNVALLWLLPAAVVTGLVANTAGTRWGIHPSVYHGTVALAVLILAPWKQVVIRRGLAESEPVPWVSVGLLTMVATTLATGLAHAIGYRGRIGPLTLMQVHIGGALSALVLLWAHYRKHPARVRRDVDLERRALMRTAGFALASVAAWLSFEGVLDLVGARGGERRFTGSHERGSFDPNGFPVTSWLDDRVQRIDGSEWMLSIDGVSWTLDDVASVPTQELDAVLDCTSAWYTEQTWTGVRLDQLVTMVGRRSLEVRSSTGYARRFPMRDLESLWLVTHVGGEPLSAGHGYPARIVAPGRRGYWWVKWVVSINTSDVPWWIQSPFPAT